MVVVAGVPASGEFEGELELSEGAGASAGADAEAPAADAAAAAAPAPAPAPAGPLLKPTHGLFSPLALPAKPHFPNLTALAVDVHASLTSAVRDAVIKAASVSPSLCPNSTTRAVVKCVKSSCDAKPSPCGASQVCVPACGSCTEHK
jgi:hypothetical protein